MTASFDKFNSMGYPTTHLKMYVRAKQSLGADDDILAQMFLNTLTGSSLKQFLNLDNSKFSTWNDIYNEFVKLYWNDI